MNTLIILLRAESAQQAHEQIENRLLSSTLLLPNGGPGTKVTLKTQDTQPLTQEQLADLKPVDESLQRQLNKTVSELLKALENKRPNEQVASYCSQYLALMGQMKQPGPPFFNLETDSKDLPTAEVITTESWFMISLGIPSSAEKNELVFK